MSTSSKLAAFQAKITKKATEITYKDTTPPATALDILKSFKSASKPSTSTSNVYRVDMCPDFTPAFLYLLLTANSDRALIQSAKNPKVSVYTYVAYQLHLIYCWFLLHDLYVAPNDCVYADSLLEDKFFTDALEDVLDYPVTPHVIEIISFWSTSNLENQQNIWVTPSFAGYLHHTHFGRSFPVQMLFAAHNVVASNSANAKHPELMYEFATCPLYKIKNFVPSPFAATVTPRPRTYTPDHYFSLLRPDATVNTKPAPLGNKVNQILKSFLNFDNIKAQKAAAPFASIPLAAPLFTAPHGYINPYVMLTSLTRKNTSELQTVYDAVKSVILLQKLSNTNLAACFTSVPSSGIVNHGYSDFPIPHWDAWPLATIAEPTAAASKMSDTDISDHQVLIAFKTHHLVTPTTGTIPQAYPTFTRRILNMFTTTLNLTSTPAWPGNLTRVNAVLTTSNATTEATLIPLANHAQTQNVAALNPADYDEVPLRDDPTDVANIDDSFADTFPSGTLKQFDDHKDVFPNVKVIMPQGFNVDSAPLVTLRGLIIYTEDLTSAAIPQLTSNSEVFDDNSQFLQSAIPYALTHLATDFQSKFVRPSRATHVPRLAAVSQPAVSMIRHHSAVFMPHLERNIFHLGSNHIGYGLTTPTNRQRLPLFSQTFIGHVVHTRARTNAAHINSGPVNTPTGHLLVWSPYTFRAPSFEIDLEDDTDFTPIAETLRATYFITNLRTWFGTSQQVVEVKSPLHSLPSA